MLLESFAFRSRAVYEKAIYVRQSLIFISPVFTGLMFGRRTEYIKELSSPNQLNLFFSRLTKFKICALDGI